MTVFEFLDAVTTNASLKIIREQCKPVYLDSPEDQNTIEEIEAIVDLDEGIPTTVDALPRYKKAPKRNSSPYLKGLIATYEKTVCEATDTGCLLQYLAKEINQGSFEFGLEKAGIDRLRLELGKLYKLIDGMHHNTHSARDAFTTFTSVFKSFLLGRNRAETLKSGPYMSVVLDVLHVSESRFSVVLEQQQENLRRRLSNKYTETYSDVQHSILELYRLGMSKDAKRKDVMGLLLALETACGSRKGSYMDPTIKYMTYTDYQQSRSKAGKAKQPLGFGIANDEEDLIFVDLDGWNSVVEDGSNFILVVVGVLKNKEESINRFLVKGDNRWVLSRVLIKPTLTLTAAQVVRGVARFRSYFNITPETFRGRRAEANRFGSAWIGPILKNYYPQSWAKAQLANDPMGSHYCRKIFANASYKVYKDQIAMLTKRRIDRSIWISRVLGHSKDSLFTFLSYTVVQIHMDMSPKVFSLPPLELVRNLYALCEDLQKQILDLKTGSTVDPVAALERHVARAFKTVEDRDSSVQAVIDRLVEAGIKPTKSAVLQLGIGSGTYLAFKQHLPLKARKKRKLNAEDQAIESAIVVVPEELKSDRSESKTATIPPGSYVVVSKNMRRNEAVFGRGRVMLESDLPVGAVVLRDQIITRVGAKSLTRDLYFEPR
jgi:hypothetical protein